MIEEKSISIRELNERLEEKDQELATRNNPQEVAWRKRILDSAVQILQKERHYPYYEEGGEMKHPCYKKVKRDLMSTHPKFTSLNLD